VSTSSPAWAASGPLILGAVLYLTLGLAGIAPPYRCAWFWCGCGVMAGEGIAGHLGALGAAAVSAVVALLVFKPHRGKHRNDERKTT
jgi:hypothetical protein